MKRSQSIHLVLIATTVALLAVCFTAQPSIAAEKTAAPKIEGDVAWYNPEDWGVEGRVWDDTEKYYHRFPARAKKTVRKPVWGLSTNPSGMCVFFETDSNKIDVR